MPDPDTGAPGAPPPTPGIDPAVAALEARLGCLLPDPALALAAITHKSFVNEHRGEELTDNERLEFLGDAVIDLAVSHRLMERFPLAREGDLSKIRASLVDEAALARMARTLDLGPLLRLGRGEELTGGREKASLLADALEAVVAAIYLGGGLAPVLRLLDGFLGEAFEKAAAGTLDRDYKTQMQELAQSRARATPRYRVVAERGPDHEKTFEVEIEVRGEVLGRGVGRSKKDAEQGAARAGLEVLSARPVVELAELPPVSTEQVPAQTPPPLPPLPAVTPALDQMPVITVEEAIAAALAAREATVGPPTATSTPTATPSPTPTTTSMPTATPTATSGSRKPGRKAVRKVGAKVRRPPERVRRKVARKAATRPKPRRR
jgi:ribonuclease-3